MKQQKVLSLFNGMNCIGMALSNLNVNFQIYASEIDKYANKISSTLFSETINLGDVVFVRRAICWKQSTIDRFFASNFLSQQTKNKLQQLLYLRDVEFNLLVAGSPCQGFSFAGKQQNFKDPRSKLFFDFVKILKTLQSKNSNMKFLLENVRMKKQYEDIISTHVGIKPIIVNSSLLSAQNRVRLYWTDLGPLRQKAMFEPMTVAIPQPKDKGILLKDILQQDVDEKYYISNKQKEYILDPERLKKRHTQVNGEVALTMTARSYANWNGDFVKINKEGKVKSNQDKSSCFTAGGKSAGNHSDMDLIAYKSDSNSVIQLNPSKESNGKSPNLDTDGRKNILEPNNLEDLKIRRLTPIECCRLQTIPNWAIEKIMASGVSDTQIYKMLGNGWTVDVITYFASFFYKK